MDIVTYGALNKKVGEKLSSNQGTQNAGKMLGINNEGEIQPIQVLGGNVSVTETLESGEDYSMVIEEGEPTAVTSVAGKYGTVTLDAGDIEYNEQEVYNSGTVGKEVGDLKSQIEEISQSGIDASGASDGQVPVADGQGSWAWDDPAGGVSDVQVNGVSVVTDGVANLPIASSNLGVVSSDSNYGITISQTGVLIIKNASGAIIKLGGSGQPVQVTQATYHPVVPRFQHESTFYGLAKAAGSDEKDSTLPVGQYTESAKSAIQMMLGIAGIVGNVEGATASQSYSIGDAFLHGGALYKATASIAANDAIVPGTNCEQTTILDMMKGA